VKRGYWIASIFGALFVVLGVTAFQKTLTPYVSFDEARRARGVVQVMGGLDKTSDRYDADRGELLFDLVDPQGGKIPVAYRGIKPGNFKDAISIVAIGRYDSKAGRIDAEKLLVKCPSKYQGAEVQKSYPASPAAPPGSRS
jgi:cytochrome c-type biogenesis protein CcmE